MMPSPIRHLFIHPNDFTDPRLVLDPEAAYLDRDLRLTTGLRRSECAYARARGRLHWARHMGEVYYIGRWLHAWIESEEDRIERRRLAELGPDLLPMWRKWDRPSDVEADLRAEIRSVGEILGDAVAAIEGGRLRVVGPDSLKSTTVDGRMVAESVNPREGDGRVRKAREREGNAKFGNPGIFENLGRAAACDDADSPDSAQADAGAGPKLGRAPTRLVSESEPFSYQTFGPSQLHP